MNEGMIRSWVACSVKLMSKRTIGGPETFGGLNEDIIKKSCIAVSKKLRTDQCEDCNSGIHLVIVVH